MQTHQLSLYIPRVFANISKERMTQVFESLQIGQVAYVDFVPREDSNTGEPYNMAFVHFTKYYDNTGSENFQTKVKDPNHEAKIVYDDPWYWICLPNLNPKPDSIRELENRVAVLEQTVNRLLWNNNNGYHMQSSQNNTTSLFPLQNTAAWGAVAPPPVEGSYPSYNAQWFDYNPNQLGCIIGPPPPLPRCPQTSTLSDEPQSPRGHIDIEGEYASEFDAFSSDVFSEPTEVETDLGDSSTTSQIEYQNV